MQFANCNVTSRFCQRDRYATSRFWCCCDCI